MQVFQHFQDVDLKPNLKNLSRGSNSLNSDSEQIKTK